MGDSGLLVVYGNTIDPRINRKVQAAKYRLTQAPLSGVVEIVPAYCSILIIFDPLALDAEEIKKVLTDLDSPSTRTDVPASDLVEVPVCYGGQYGPDLTRVADHNGLVEEEVIRLHSQARYPVYMLGFTPGFPYLGGLPEKLHTPRLDSPRIKVPAGSVGIANNQTGIYPIESPGGWQLIGRTPLKLFDPGRSTPFLLKAGDLLKFKPICADEYKRIEQSI
jgi:KipI family sensor histidine kinase inhibitor